MNLGNLLIGMNLLHWRFGRIAEMNSSVQKTVRYYYGPFYYIKTIRRY